jgi:hypothetical protein
MHKIEAMSKISTLHHKNRPIDVFIRERLGGHKAPYIVIELQDGSEAHLRIKDKKVFDSSVKKADIIAFVQSWIDAYMAELLASWEAALHGKALPVPSDMPKVGKDATKEAKEKVKKKPVKKKKTESSFTVRKIKEIRTNRHLQMVIRFENSEIRVIDFAKDVIPKNKAFDVLKNPRVFMAAKAHRSAVVWESVDIDIEASDLYDISYSVELPDIKLRKSS